MKKNFLITLVLSLVFISCKNATVSNNVKTTDESKVELNDSKWRLVKLNGKTIEESKDSNRMLGVIFTPDGNFSAYAGCNSMSGSYQLNEEISRISFSKITTTMMACADMLIEQELGKVLEITDNYNFDGKTFKLNKARMAPIAEFELIK